VTHRGVARPAGTFVPRVHASPVLVTDIFGTRISVVAAIRLARTLSGRRSALAVETRPFRMIARVGVVMVAIAGERITFVVGTQISVVAAFLGVVARSLRIAPIDRALVEIVAPHLVVVTLSKHTTIDRAVVSVVAWGLLRDTLTGRRLAVCFQTRLQPLASRRLAMHLVERAPPGNALVAPGHEAVVDLPVVVVVWRTLMRRIETFPMDLVENIVCTDILVVTRT
jgi:hypothetical protein